MSCRSNTLLSAYVDWVPVLKCCQPASVASHGGATCQDENKRIRESERSAR